MSDLSVKQEKIVVTISADGSVEVDVKGVKGTSCKDLTKFLEDMGTTDKTKVTDEYYERDFEPKVTIKL